jgi:AcrR family transcriptional regulator
MARKYELKRRAERQAETRRRIVEAAIDLHATVGPARTTVSAIADRAGVQRHTVYSHFPAERELYDACSGLHLEQSPLPDPEAWLRTEPGEGRLREGLRELYAWYAANESLMANVTRDAEVHPILREVAEARFGPVLGRMREILAEGLGDGRRTLALIGLALEFRTWRSLVREGGLDAHDAVETMVTALRCR